VSYDESDTTRTAIDAALAAGFTRITLGLPAPWPDGVAGWVASDLLGGLRPGEQEVLS
jgi:hypothetical protein